MNRKELMEWLESCPTHKWEVTNEADDGIWVLFPINEEYEENNRVD